MSANSILSETHSDYIHYDDPRTEMTILRAGGIIRMKLAVITTGTSIIETTPYAAPPLIPKADEEGSGENSGSGILAGIQPASTAYTELWTVTFSSASAFSVSGSFSGSQGTGSTASAFTSTNSDIVIPSDCWSGTPATGDIFYVIVYKHLQEIVVIASMLAVGLIYKGLSTGAAVGDNPEGINFYKDALSLLDQLISGNKGGILGSTLVPDGRDLMVPYEISAQGYDITGYRTDEFDRYVSGTYWWSCYV